MATAQDALPRQSLPIRLVSGRPLLRRTAAGAVTAATRPLAGRLLERYLARHDHRRLLLGAGPHRPAGWLATDILPLHPSIMYLDATRPFPMPDGSFDVIACEHMIEHLDAAGGATMLAECRRVLRPGGVLRVATPDARRFLSMPGRELDPDEVRYVRWANRMADAPEGEADNPIFTVNQLMRAWGHQFLYDERTLGAAMRRAGFGEIRTCSPGESADPVLRDVERHADEVGEIFNAIETMVIEARTSTTEGGLTPASGGSPDRSVSTR